MHHPSRDLMDSYLDGLFDTRIIKELPPRVAA
jgi:hypothetical protein